ncbi:MAG: hypothetical protein Terrestrivirus1_230 [Terrestrivirus sp.]|uniref:Uncharacterized protein n=1 Tax=Terrestrivirus sp. TaxID=2487775 RepID=A0A3G4ZKI8_9VIRU|nr:MAG: hypothetical protein Terrestrivirus1_230 [Terrestrivirus sp.]
MSNIQPKINVFIINDANGWNNINNFSLRDINIYLITKDLDIQNNKTLDLTNSVIIGVVDDAEIEPIPVIDNCHTYYIPPNVSVSPILPGYFIKNRNNTNILPELKGYKCYVRFINFSNPLFNVIDTSTTGFLKFTSQNDITTTTNGAILASVVLINSIIKSISLECNHNIFIKFFGQNFIGNGLFIGYNRGVVIDSELQVKNAKSITVIGAIIGGFVGINDVNGVIENCHSIIKNNAEVHLISVTDFINGGFIGLNESVVSNCTLNMCNNKKINIISKLEDGQTDYGNPICAGFVGYELNGQTINNNLNITNNDVIEFDSALTASGFGAGGGGNIIHNNSLFKHNKLIKIISKNTIVSDFAYADGFVTALNINTLIVNNVSRFIDNDTIEIKGKNATNFISNNANNAPYNKSYIKCNKFFDVISR